MQNALLLRIFNQSDCNPILEPLVRYRWKVFGSRSFQNQSLKNGCVTNDGGNWQLIEIGPFQLQNDSDLEFQFVDTVNPCWKSGMKWDYIELRLNAQSQLASCRVHKQLWLVVSSHWTCFNQSEWTASEQSSNANLKFVFDTKAWLSVFRPLGMIHYFSGWI